MHGQITRKRETRAHSWSPALPHQQSTQLHAFLQWESKSRVVAACRSHALYAPITSPLKVGVPALLARLTYGHDARNIPGFRICRRDVRTLFQVTA